MFTGLLSVIASVSVVFFGWVFNLGMRVTALESKHEDLITLINFKFDTLNQRLDRNGSFLERFISEHLKDASK